MVYRRLSLILNLFIFHIKFFFLAIFSNNLNAIFCMQRPLMKDLNSFSQFIDIEWSSTILLIALLKFYLLWNTFTIRIQNERFKLNSYCGSNWHFQKLINFNFHRLWTWEILKKFFSTKFNKRKRNKILKWKAFYQLDSVSCPKNKEKFNQFH